ncbi:MAG: hypothetical protein LBR08_13810 [Bacteroidales bacterium]|nr:hypothetical protein [Bacteroidales bacterium]
MNSEASRNGHGFAAMYSGVPPRVAMPCSSRSVEQGNRPCNRLGKYHPKRHPDGRDVKNSGVYYITIYLRREKLPSLRSHHRGIRFFHPVFRNGK